MADLILPTPDGVADATRSVWTPTNVQYIQSWVAGTPGEDSLRAIKHEFKLNYMGETEYFGVLAEEGCSEAQIEDMAAGVMERVAATIVEKQQRKDGKKTPEYYANKANLSERHDLAEAFRDFKKDTAKRRASSNNKIFYQGLK